MPAKEVEENIHQFSSVADEESERDTASPPSSYTDSEPEYDRDDETEEYYKSRGITYDISIAHHKERYESRLFRNDGSGSIKLDVNNITTFAYITAPIVSVLRMGHYDYIGVTSPCIHLGRDVWLELSHPLNCCIIRDSVERIQFTIRELISMQAVFCQPCNPFNPLGVISLKNVPCAFSHNSMDEMVKCKVCGGACWPGHG
jgi:hypothetical protein